ncbi:MAG TPA: PRC-barrel domain-containing protein [Dehalococcoidia bacterium]|nr:PRC-barrel domain-containing protein [Dehalococcoidia bacterium]
MPVLPHQLQIGAEVFSSDGHKLGTLHRVVLRRTDLSITDIVVDIGFLRSGRRLWEGGLGLDYDRILTIESVAAAADDGVRLNLTADEFKAMPEYTEESFEEPQDLTPGEFDIPDVITRAQGIAAAISNAPGGWLVGRLNKPIESVEIVEGTPVWRRDPHQKVGEVKRLIFDDPGRLQALVIERGFLLHRDVILPVRYVAELIDDIVRLDITDAELESLREFQDQA